MPRTIEAPERFYSDAVENWEEVEGVNLKVAAYRHPPGRDLREA